jgi:orotate phosphoribosyltransferase
VTKLLCVIADLGLAGQFLLSGYQPAAQLPQAVIGGLELGAVPIICTVCARSWPDRPIRGFIVRKEKKGHGTDKKIDGNFRRDTSHLV